MGNNPVNFNDPTGHMQESETYLDNDGKCDGDQACIDLKVKIDWKKTQNDAREKLEYCDEHPWVSECQLSYTAPPPMSISGTTIGPTPVTNQSTFFGDQVHYWEFMNNVLDAAQWSIKADRLIYKGFLWAKAFNPVPGVDFILGAAGQAISDLDRRNLTGTQRAGRALVVGIESAITGVISDMAGGAGFLAGEFLYAGGGGLVTGPLLAVGSSVYMDEVVWTDFNQQRFDGWNLGSYP